MAIETYKYQILNTNVYQLFGETVLTTNIWLGHTWFRVYFVSRISLKATLSPIQRVLGTFSIGQEVDRG
jgi:hypothetical protein